jgi:hypothetical protein
MTNGIKLVTDKAELDKLIKSIASAGTRLDQQIQLAGLSCLDHLKKHGDVGFVNRLYLALSKGARKAAMSSWLLTHGSLVANADANKKEMPFKFTKDKGTNVEAAAADPWYDHKPDAAPDEVFDLAKAIEGIIKKAKGKQLVHAELLTPLQGLMTVINAADKAADVATETTTDTAQTAE